MPEFSDCYDHTPPNDPAKTIADTFPHAECCRCERCGPTARFARELAVLMRKHEVVIWAGSGGISITHFGGEELCVGDILATAAGVHRAANRPKKQAGSE